MTHEEVKEVICNHNTGNAETIQKFNKIYRGEDVIDEQRTAMKQDKIRYAGGKIEQAVKHCYMINNTLPLLTKGTSEFSNRDMAKKIIQRNLSGQAMVKFITNAGNACAKIEIMVLCQRLKKHIDVKSEVK